MAEGEHGRAAREHGGAKGEHERAAREQKGAQREQMDEMGLSARAKWQYFQSTESHVLFNSEITIYIYIVNQRIERAYHEVRQYRSRRKSHCA